MRRLFIALLICSAIASGAFSKSYTYTVGGAVVTSGPHTDFPVLISVSDPGLKSTANGGVVTDAQGDDICIYSDSGKTTLMKWKIVTWNSATGDLVAWVKDPALANSNVYYIGAGDAAITTFQGDSVNVWNAAYTGVYELPDGSTLSLLDSTSNARNGTGVNTPTATTGKVDGGMALASASTQYVGLGTGINPTAITFSAWVNGTSFPNAYNCVVCRYGDVVTYFLLYVKSDGKVAAFSRSDTSFQGVDGIASPTLSTGTWYHLASSYDSTNGLRVYINGSLGYSEAASGGLRTDTAATTRIGSDSGTASREWNGAIDEVHISTTARSAGWIATEYTDQNNPGAFGTLTEITATRRIYVIN